MSASAADISPVLTNSRVPPMAEGNPDTMLARMIMEIPFPTPRSVICSPNHIRNIVPVTSVMAAVSTKFVPGLITTPWFCKAVAAAVDWNVQISRSRVPS